jgi:hypothetical protein
MPDPPGLVPALRVVMGPVDHAAAVVPLVFAVERHLVADTQRVDARRQVDVVRDQHRLAGCELHDEALVAAAVVVVVEQPRHRALAAYLHVAALAGIGLGKRIGSGVARIGRGRRCRIRNVLRRLFAFDEAEVDDGDRDQDQQQFLHGVQLE